jgi:hypothetical protein
VSRELRDALILALIPLAAVAFSLFEWGGITNAPWSTISKYAQEDHRLAIALLILPWVAAAVYSAWWIHHIWFSFIPRLHLLG